jgi:hypothetical protein
MRALQIGVMGSAADLNYEKRLEQIAEEITNMQKLLLSESSKK